LFITTYIEKYCTQPLKVKAIHIYHVYYIYNQTGKFLGGEGVNRKKDRKITLLSLFQEVGSQQKRSKSSKKKTKK